MAASGAGDLAGIGFGIAFEIALAIIGGCFEAAVEAEEEDEKFHEDFIVLPPLSAFFLVAAAFDDAFAIPAIMLLPLAVVAFKAGARELLPAFFSSMVSFVVVLPLLLSLAVAVVAFCFFLAGEDVLFATESTFLLSVTCRMSSSCALEKLCSA